jgi:hypothetical protein
MLVYQRVEIHSDIRGRHAKICSSEMHIPRSVFAAIDQAIY